MNTAGSAHLSITVTPYRWLIFALIVMGSLSYMLMWLSPAALMTVIQADLKIDIGAAGILITIIPLLNGLFIFGGSLVIDKLGLKWASALAMLLLACGGGLSFFATSYSLILAARVLVGIGAGLTSPTTGALTMAWFPAREQPFINALVSVLGYLGMTLAFVTAVPLFNALGSWQLALVTMALVPLATVAGWVIFGRNPPQTTVAQTLHAIDYPVDTAPLQKAENGILQAAKRREIWLLAVGAVGQLWAFNTLTAFLPSWFETTWHLDKAVAGNITGILPIAGIVGGLVCGFASAAVGLRKPFLWPLMVIMLISTLVIANVAPGPLVYLCVGLCGFASSGWVPPMLTIPMELEGATPQFVGGAMALIFGVGFTVSFFVSPLFGALMPYLGMKTTLILFSLPLLLSIFAFSTIAETGPRRRVKN